MNHAAQIADRFSVEFHSEAKNRYSVSSRGDEISFEICRTLGINTSSPSRVSTVYGSVVAENLKARCFDIYEQVVEEFQNVETYKTFLLHAIGAYDSSAYLNFCISKVVSKLAAS